MNEQAGFTLIETVCAMAIVALLAALILPSIPRSTSEARLAGYALDVAGLLKGDRNAAVRSRAIVSTTLDPRSRTIRSGSSAAIVEIPADVAFDALLAQRCGARLAGSTIDFFPSGESCGGVIAVARKGVGYQIRVNWLTGGVEVVAIGGS